MKPEPMRTWTHIKAPLVPATPSARFSRVFTVWVRGMMRRDFASVRLARGSAGCLERIEAHPGPAIVLLNHASWWDPLIGLVLAQRFAPTRTLASPIDADQLAKFRFMRRLGLFGLDPTHPDALDLFVEHCGRLFRDEPRTLLGLTPQGAFADVRAPVRLRPGAASVAARLGGVMVVSIACELPFWFDRRPELLIRAEACEAPETPGTTAWLRAMTRVMRRNAEALAERSIARDDGAFEPLFERTGARVNPVYDLIARARGVSAAIERRERGGGGQRVESGA
jgi:1-acyl-sn-glycerol-3-phosphate acyltransferase